MTSDRSSVFWWIYVSVLLGAALFIAHSFVAILVLGLFGYYATRPIRSRFQRVVDSKRVAAGLTALTVLLPLLMLTLYAGLRTVQQIQARFEGSLIEVVVSRVFGVDVEEFGSGDLLQNPPPLTQVTDRLVTLPVEQGMQILNLISGTVLLVALAVTLSYALLVYDETLSTVFAKIVGGRDETVYAYALAVDTDLESIFFGNLLFVLVMSVIATVTYLLTNLVAPPGLAIPMVFTLGFLTGLTSLLPVVVSKVIYLPIVGYLTFTTFRSGDGHFLFVGGVLVAYVLLLDLFPQSLLQPYISGRRVNPMILLFAYILGPILFGWYGFFLLPIVFILMLEAVRIVLPDLLHGDPIATEPAVAEGMGATAEEIQTDDTTQSPASDDADPEAS